MQFPHPDTHRLMNTEHPIHDCPWRDTARPLVYFAFRHFSTHWEHTPLAQTLEPLDICNPGIWLNQYSQGPKFPNNYLQLVETMVSICGDPIPPNF